MDFSVAVQSLERAIAAVPGLIAVLVALWLGKLIFDHTHTFDVQEEIEDKQNGAFGLVYAAYFVALALGMLGALFQDPRLHVWSAASKIFTEGCLVLLLMRASLWINDRLILTGFSVIREICEDRNYGVAFCVAGALVATGLSINGAFTGYSLEGESFGYLLRDILLYWAVGQVILVVGARLYQWTAGFDVHRNIELDDNTAVGMSFGGFLAGLGLIARASVIGAGQNSLADEILYTAAAAIIGVGLLLAARMAINLAFLKRFSLNAEISLEDNPAVGALAMGGYLSSAVLLSACLQRI